MNESRTIKNPSPLVLAVLNLDEHFSELIRLSSRIDEIDLKSSFDFEQSEKLISLFAEMGNAITQDMGQFAAVLNETREKAENAAQLVSVKADQLKSRKNDIQEKIARFQALSTKVNILSESLAPFKQPAAEDSLSEDEKANLKSRLGEIGSQLQALIDEAQTLKEIGQVSKIKVLEQNADSMRQSLIAVSKKINSVNVVQ